MIVAAQRGAYDAAFVAALVARRGRVDGEDTADKLGQLVNLDANAGDRVSQQRVI